MNVKENKEEVLKLVSKIKDNLIKSARESLNEKFFSEINSSYEMQITLFDKDHNHNELSDAEVLLRSIEVLLIAIEDAEKETIKFRFVISTTHLLKNLPFCLLVELETPVSNKTLSEDIELCSGLIGPIRYYDNGKKGIEFNLNDSKNPVRSFISFKYHRIPISSKKVYETFLPVLKRLSTMQFEPPSEKRAQYFANAYYKTDDNLSDKKSSQNNQLSSDSRENYKLNAEVGKVEETFTEDMPQIEEHRGR